MHDFDGHFWGMHFLWWIIWFFLILWIFLVPKSRPDRTLRKEKPLQILKRRFAKGEITKEEYEESKNILMSDNSTLNK